MEPWLIASRLTSLVCKGVINVDRVPAPLYEQHHYTWRRRHRGSVVLAVKTDAIVCIVACTYMQYVLIHGVGMNLADVYLRDHLLCCLLRHEVVLSPSAWRTTLACRWTWLWTLMSAILDDERFVTGAVPDVTSMCWPSAWRKESTMERGGSSCLCLLLDVPLHRRS